MGLISFAKRKAIERGVKYMATEAAKDLAKAQSGPLVVLARFLSGWKSVIVLLLVVAQNVCAAFGITGPFAYLSIAFSAFGWSPSDAAVDPVLVTQAVLTLLAVGHAFAKAWKDYPLGVPPHFHPTIPGEAVDVKQLKREAA